MESQGGTQWNHVVFGWKVLCLHALVSRFCDYGSNHLYTKTQLAIELPFYLVKHFGLLSKKEAYLQVLFIDDSSLA